MYKQAFEQRPSSKTLHAIAAQQQPSRSQQQQQQLTTSSPFVSAL
jgi:hypothetical protein